MATAEVFRKHQSRNAVTAPQEKQRVKQRLQRAGLLDVPYARIQPHALRFPEIAATEYGIAITGKAFTYQQIWLVLPVQVVNGVAGSVVKLEGAWTTQWVR